MLGDPPRTFPHQMPMTAAVAPRFAERYPEAAIVFDNLHSMHDVISDILANPGVARDAKRAEILRAARLFRDDTSYVMPVEAWRAMSRHMGVENMGGPSVGFLPALPTPTVTYGAVMRHDERTGEMIGFGYGGPVAGAAGADAHAGHGTPAAAPAAAAPDPHAGHAMPAAARDTTHATAGGDAHARQVMALHMRMVADSAIRRRLLADTAMRRMLVDMRDSVPAAHRAHLDAVLADTVSLRKPATRRAPAARPATRPAPKPTPRPADPHAGHTPARKP